MPQALGSGIPLDHRTRDDEIGKEPSERLAEDVFLVWESKTVRLPRKREYRRLPRVVIRHFLPVFQIDLHDRTHCARNGYVTTIIHGYIAVLVTSEREPTATPIDWTEIGIRKITVVVVKIIFRIRTDIQEFANHGSLVEDRIGGSRIRRRRTLVERIEIRERYRQS